MKETSAGCEQKDLLHFVCSQRLVSLCTHPVVRTSSDLSLHPPAPRKEENKGHFNHTREATPLCN